VEYLENRTTPTVITLTPSADNTLYQVATADPAQQLSDGAGRNFFVGRTAQGSNDIRRGAVKFDFTTVPAGSTIKSVTLTLTLAKTRAGAPAAVVLHRALMNWGEGTSDAGQGGVGSGEGDGVQATPGDVTWFFASFPTQRWTTPGGDFVAAASASTSVGSVGRYQWSGAGMTADVQQWVNNPATDFGWIVTGDESTGGTSRLFDTKEIPIAANRPTLTVDFTPPAPADLTIAKTHTGNFRQGDAADTYTLTVSNVGAGPTTGTVTVTDQLPTGLAPTPADNGLINGWNITTSGQTITATRGDALGSGSSYPVLTLSVSVAPNAPASVTNTANVAGGGDVNTANNSASDPTSIIQVADLTVALSHTGGFKQGDSADTYTVSVSNIGPAPTVGTVTVTDTLPTGLAPTAADTGLINGWSVTTTGQTITATRSDVLVSGGSYPALTLSVSVAPTAPASVTNTVNVAGGGDVNSANNTAQDVTPITQVADLTIGLSHTGTFRPGDAADTYTVTVRNVGAAPTDGSPVTVTDTLPAGLTPRAADSGTINGWAVSFSGQIVTATRSDVLNSGASYPPLTVTVSVANNIALTVTNTASVAGGGDVNTANNTATDPTATTPVADMTLALSHSGNFKQGDSADTYTVTVSNIGPGSTVGTVTVTDTLPTGLAPTAADTGLINGWSVTTTGQTIAATRSDVLASGGSYPPLTLSVSVAPTAPASVTNTASVAGGGEVNTANNTANDPTPIVQVADLTLALSHSGSFHPGDSADTYTILVSNVGAVPTDGSPVTVTDTLPAGLAPTALDSGLSNGWSITTDGQTITATRVEVLASGGSYPALTLSVSVARQAPANVTNMAHVAGGGEVNTANNTAEDNTTITPVADLKIALSHSGSFTASETGTYTITISNVGEAATNAPVTVVDTLPTGLTYSGPDTVNGWSVAVDGQTITASRQDVLANGASFPALILTVTVDENSPVFFTNSATVSGGGEVNLKNDTASDFAMGQTQRRRGASSSPAQLAAAALNDIAGTFAHSDEYLSRLVTQNYVQLLHRKPTVAEVNSWVGLLNNGMSNEQVLAGFASSSEYFLLVGGTDQGWVSALYHDVLGRGSDTGGAAVWLSQLAAGMSRFDVAQGFATSAERQMSNVAGYYELFLGRPAEASELAGWVNQMALGMSDQQVIMAFVTSNEFFIGQGSSFQGWLGGVYQLLLGRPPDSDGFNYWQGYIQQRLSAG
jgi:uncharacterized repeat protein (TIGR01451 family)